MYKISSLEAGTRFKFYGHTFTLGAMEWTITGKDKELERAIITNPGIVDLPLDVVSCTDELGKQYWIPTSYEVQVIEHPKSNLADLSIKNKVERIERTVADHNDKIDTLFGQANSLNLAGVLNDIEDAKRTAKGAYTEFNRYAENNAKAYSMLENRIKKIEADKQSFDCVEEIRKLQNDIYAIRGIIQPMTSLVGRNSKNIADHEQYITAIGQRLDRELDTDTKIFSEISARLDKLEGKLSCQPLPEYAPTPEMDLSKSPQIFDAFEALSDQISEIPGYEHFKPKPKTPQVGWRKIDPNNLPEGKVVAKNDDDDYIYVGCNLKDVDRYILLSDLLNLPEIQ